MHPIVTIENLNKIYDGGFQALKEINLEIQKGEIFALLGPNGAGKTTLIGITCGLKNLSSGKIQVDGFDIIQDYRQTRRRIGLVPQELTTDAFETVWDTVSFSRGLFGKKKNPDYIEKLLKDFSLWDKRKNRLMTLSGGMKRRVMICKALSHEPTVLFLDEPTAGVDVELRKDMWNQVRMLKEEGVTIILTTHYIEEAEEMADRVGVISKGQLILTEAKKDLMKKLGKKQMIFDLNQKLSSLPSDLDRFDLKIAGHQLIYTYDYKKETDEIYHLLEGLNKAGVGYADLSTKQSSLEEIFVELVNQK